jgi:Flp pilus assembly pilin Flp
MVYILGHPSAHHCRQSNYVACRGGGRSFCVSKIGNGLDLEEVTTMQHLFRLWREDEGQDIAEYAVMLAVILVIVVGTIRLIGSNANNVFSEVASSVQ